MKIHISKEGNSFIVDPVDKPGSPRVGRGNTLYSALGNFLIGYQEELGIEIKVLDSAQRAEQRRRKRELDKR